MEDYDYCSTNAETRKVCDSFYLTKSASYTTIGTGSLVAISSLIVIHVIWKSQIRLSSVYHRIMFAMCLYDFAGSIAMALTTIPMPKDQIYPFESDIASYGTVATCEAQSFIYVISSFASSTYFCGLSIFYMCIIAFRLSDKTIRNCLEPCIHLFCIVLSTTAASLALSAGMLNPSPYEAWCSVAPYPWECSNIEGVECIRGGGLVSETYLDSIQIYFAAIIGGGAMVVLFSMGAIIVVTFWKSAPITGDGEQSKAWRTLRRTLASQAFMYVGVFTLIWIFRIVALFNGNPKIQSLRLISLHGQGFLNALVFMYHKIHNIRRADPTITVIQALFLVIVNPEDVPEVKLTGLSLISKDVKANVIPKVSLPSIEEGVDDASKEMNLSYELSHEMSEEIYFTLDHSNAIQKEQQVVTNIIQEETKSRGFEGSQFSEEPSKESFQDSDISFSQYDASTVKASNW